MGAIFQNRVQEYGDKTLVKYKNTQGAWEELSWNTLNSMVRDIGMFLINKEIQPGDKVALFSPNRYEWWIADLAIISVGAVNVPIYATNSPEECRYIIENSDSKMCFVGTGEHMDKILQIKDKLPNLREIIIFDNLDKPVPGVITFQDACKEGKAAMNKDEFDTRLVPINIEDVATIIYTSGTTGNPKGVMLTHKNFVSNVNQVQAASTPNFSPATTPSSHSSPLHTPLRGRSGTTALSSSAIRWHLLRAWKSSWRTSARSGPRS